MIKLFRKQKKVKGLVEIVSSFNQVVQELSTLEAHNSETITQNEATIKRIQENNAALQAEKEQAVNVRSRIVGLIS